MYRKFSVVYLFIIAGSAAALDAGVNAGTFKIVGNSGVSAQQAILGNNNKVYVLDKAENNALKINGHPAWVTEYDTDKNVATPQDVKTNTFCAGGSALGDGRIIAVGGNQAVTYNGEAVNGGSNPYQNANGGNVIRLLTPGGKWQESQLDQGGNRWYPSVETMADGSVMIVGGFLNGGYINDQYQDNPTYEFYPPRAGGSRKMNFLSKTLPLNLYALTWLLPSGKLFLQASYSASLFDINSEVETVLPNMPHAVRVYPANAAVSMLPLVPSNNYTATLLFCGGQELPVSAFGNSGGPAYAITQVKASQSCVRMSPDSSNPSWEEDDNLIQGRVMGNFIILPTGKLFLVNGAASGTAGYGSPSAGYPNVVGQSYADNAILQPAIYDPEAPRGQRFSTEGLQSSTIPRMYHSTATLLPDGSVWVSGSNPNADVSSVKYPTEYRTEKFYPPYYNKARPQPKGLPSSLSYGGNFFNVTLTASDLGNNVSSISEVKVVVIRTGYSTHAVNWGMRSLQLTTTFDASGVDGILHVSQMPPNAALFQPGPALLFVVVNGVPSIGIQVMIGSGTIGLQPILPNQPLPLSIDTSSKVVNTYTPVVYSNGCSASSTQDGKSTRRSHARDFDKSLASRNACPSTSDSSCQFLTSACGKSQSFSTDPFSVSSCALAAICFDSGANTMLVAAQCGLTGSTGGAPSSRSLPRLSQTIFARQAPSGYMNQQNFIDWYYSTLSSSQATNYPSSNVVIGFYNSLSSWTKTSAYGNVADFIQYQSAPFVDTQAKTCATTTCAVPTDSSCALLYAKCLTTNAGYSNPFNSRTCLAAASCFDGGVKAFASAISCALGVSVIGTDASLYPRMTQNTLSDVASTPSANSMSQQQYVDFVYSTLSSLNSQVYPDYSYVLSNFARQTRWTTKSPIPLKNLADYFNYSG